MEQITLYYRQGASDKVYQASIEPRDGGYVVAFVSAAAAPPSPPGPKPRPR